MRANKLIQLPVATCPNCYLNRGGKKAFPDPRGPVQVFVSKVRHRIPSDRNRKKKKGQTKIIVKGIAVNLIFVSSARKMS